MIYLDHAATTPVPKAVADAMYTVLTEQYANPNAQYPFGQEMRRSVEDWRAVIAKAVDCEANQLFFTSCGTEGDNWAIRAACWQNRHVGRHIVTTAVEHHAVLNCCQQLEQEGWEVTTILPDQNGDISAESVLAAVRPDTALVSVMMVNNELGSIYPIADIAKGLKAVNEKTLLHTDAVQGFLKVPCSAKTLGADFLTISAHKIGGPVGIGLLAVRGRVNIRPRQFGGGQELGRRPGTQDVRGALAFAAAAKECASGLEASRAATATRARALYARLCAEGTGIKPTAGTVVGDDRLPGMVSLLVPSLDSETMILALDDAGFEVSAGSACSSGSLDPSHVLSAMGIPRQEALGSLRVSFDERVGSDDLDAFADAILRIVSTRSANR